MTDPRLIVQLDSLRSQVAQLQTSLEEVESQNKALERQLANAKEAARALVQALQ